MTTHSLSISSDEFEALTQLNHKCGTFSEKVLRYPTAMEFLNQNKNRYIDVLPNENTRVQLESGNYINANYIFDREYIATQAPLPHTVNDFWAMVMEHQSMVIVMLTNLQEQNKRKADLYWPTDSVPQQYGSIQVTLLFESSLNSSLIVRLFQLQDNQRSHVVTQLHHTNWGDFGVPPNTSDMITLIGTLNLIQGLSKVKCPIIVHCSAGLGRTGTFIGIHKGFQLIDSGCKKMPNILELVYAMRNCRDGMVQTREQYRYIHRVLREYLTKNI